jgi:hypothetical protein
MPIDKIFISHVVSEIIIIVGVSFYYHKKCSYLQSQIQDLNIKLEKLNVNNYLALIERQKHFEQQTVQHINKIYSILNSRGNVHNNQIFNSQNHESMSFEPVNQMSFSSENVKTTIPSEKKTQSQQSQQSQNPFLNTLSMIGPLSTMFQVVMEKKPPHPDEVLKNAKIVEIEDEITSSNEKVDTEMLDNELEDELNDLKSTSTTAANTPVLVPRTPKHYLTDNSVSSPKKCENGICKIDYTNNSQNSVEPFDIETSNSSEFLLSSNETTDNIKPTSQSSPLRYISQIPEQKRGRPKKN